MESTTLAMKLKLVQVLPHNNHKCMYTNEIGLLKSYSYTTDALVYPEMQGLFKLAL